MSRRRAHPAASVQAEFDHVFAASYHRVVGYAAVATGDVALAEDAAQEAFARAHRRWRDVGKLDRPDLWVAKVAIRVAVDGWRRRRREATLDSASPAPTPDHVQQLWMRWNLEGLTAMQRATVLLHHVDGRPIAEIAARLHRSPNTIRSHLAQARRRLRRNILEEP